MKTPRSDSDLRWEDLVRRARADIAPPLDVPALQRALSRAAPPQREGWVGEFFTVFAPARAMASCLAGAGIFGLLAAWRVWELSQALPWAQFLAVTGGAP